MGEPRLQGGPGSSVRQAALPAALPSRGSVRATVTAFGSPCSTRACSNTMADERRTRARQRRRLGRRKRRLRRRRVRPRHVHRRIDPPGRARRVGLCGQGARLARRRRRLTSPRDGAAAAGHRHRQPLARRLHRPRHRRRWRSRPRCRPWASSAPWWRRPATGLEPAVLAGGLRRGAGGRGRRAERRQVVARHYSNYGPWVDATARGSNLQSTFTREKTKVAQGSAPSPTDPTIAFDGWAAWDGTSFATPIAAACSPARCARRPARGQRSPDATARDLPVRAAARLPARDPARRARRNARALLGRLPLDRPAVRPRSQEALMTSRADFSEEEWTRLKRAPFVAGMAISLADPGGPIELVKETAATLKTVRDAAIGRPRRAGRRGRARGRQPAGGAQEPAARLQAQGRAGRAGDPRGARRGQPDRVREGDRRRRRAPIASGFRRPPRRPPMRPRRAASSGSMPSA